MNRVLRKVLDIVRVDPVAMAMPGPRLPQRIRKIIEAAPSVRVSRVRAVCIVVACVAMCAAFLTVAFSRAQTSAAQDWEKAASGRMSFEVASVKRNLSYSARPPAMVPIDATNAFSPKGGLFSGNNEPLATYIGFAYKLTTAQLLSLVSQMPRWALAENFDIEARGPAAATTDQARLMLQSLLEDRFKLAARFETRQLPVFALVLNKNAKTGPDLLPHPEGRPCSAASDVGAHPAPHDRDLLLSPACGNWMVHMGADHEHVVGSALSIAFFVSNVLPALMQMGGQALDRPIVDRTGLDGDFDITLDFWRQAGPSADSEAQSRVEGPTIIDALRDQLGLKLVSTTGPVDSIVIEHIEEPAPN